MNSKENILRAKLSEVVPSASEGLVVRAYHRGKKVCDVAEGKTYDFYDWASLTKVVFLVSNVMKLYDERAFDLREPVIRNLPWFQSRNIILGQLLNHSSGLPWWHPFYKHLSLNKTSQEKWPELAAILRKLPVKKTGKSVYSDVGILTLGFVLEALRQKPILEIWKDWNSQLELEKTYFHPDNEPVYSRARYAPTEKCPWRKKVLRGEVHDDNTWALGGVAPHAGLFGPMDDLAKWALGFRSGLRGEKNRFISEKTLKLFTTRSIPSSRGDWALGFMMPTRGAASCGKYFGPQSVGHTGFTGTSFWFDPKADLLVLILSNRVFPTRENRKFVAMRPQIHDWIYELFVRD
jgi:serine-type D-Ala-D-Ala carboxypeptidase